MGANKGSAAVFAFLVSKIPTRALLGRGLRVGELSLFITDKGKRQHYATKRQEEAVEAIER